jgi:hypothetical protein
VTSRGTGHVGIARDMLLPESCLCVHEIGHVLPCIHDLDRVGSPDELKNVVRGASVPGMWLRAAMPALESSERMWFDCVWNQARLRYSRACTAGAWSNGSDAGDGAGEEDVVRKLTAQLAGMEADPSMQAPSPSPSRQGRAGFTFPLAIGWKGAWWQAAQGTRRAFWVGACGSQLLSRKLRSSTAFRALQGGGTRTAARGGGLVMARPARVVEAWACPSQHGRPG